MRVVVAGSSGLLGSALIDSLRSDGHEVIRLVRRAASAPDESEWDPAEGRVDEALLRSADLVVNLAGASIGGRRLTASWAREILRSRLDTTELLAGVLAEAGRGHLLQASASGYYGPRGETQLNERSRPGSGTLSVVAQKWEAATEVASAAGVRVQILRTGHVLAPHGGFAERLLPLIRLGLLRSLGSGRQWMSWISLPDWVRAARFIAASDVKGPVNVVSPVAVTNRDFIAAFARAAGRPRLIPVPAWVIRVVVGPAADDILRSQVVVPNVLGRLGFQWNHRDIDAAAAWVMSRDHSRANT